MPKHYKFDGFEAIDVIEAVVMSVGEKTDPRVAYLVGSSLKYLLRAGRKDETQEDLKKAFNFLGRAITALDDKPMWPEESTHVFMD